MAYQYYQYFGPPASYRPSVGSPVKQPVFSTPTGTPAPLVATPSPTPGPAPVRPANPYSAWPSEGRYKGVPGAWWSGLWHPSQAYSGLPATWGGVVPLASGLPSLPPWVTTIPATTWQQAVQAALGNAPLMAATGGQAWPMTTASVAAAQAAAAGTGTTSAGGGGGGAAVPRLPYASGSAEWYKQFTAEHGGMTPEDYYGQPGQNHTGGQGYGPASGLQQALSDLEWSQGFQRMMGRPPNEYDWKNWWYASHGERNPSDTTPATPAKKPTSTVTPLPPPLPYR
jgi:hypothetical protein